MRQRRRGQILPLFVFMSLFMLAIAAFLIDTAGIILVSEDFRALGWRSAHFAAAQLSAYCTTSVNNLPGQTCAIDTTSYDLAKQNTIAALNAYANAWGTKGSREQIGLPVALITGFPALEVATDLRSVSVELRGCYRPFLLYRVSSAFGARGGSTNAACQPGEIFLKTTEAASLVLSN